MSHHAHMSQPAKLTVRDVAVRLDLSTATVKRLAQTGHLPCDFKVPGRTGAYVFDENVVELYRQRLAAERRSRLDRIETAS